jgi:hypothetical protein
MHSGCLFRHEQKQTIDQIRQSLSLGDEIAQGDFYSQGKRLELLREHKSALPLFQRAYYLNQTRISRLRRANRPRDINAARNQRNGDCMTISVLFATNQSVYKLLGLDVWDRKRDALRFAGSGPIIAHPPCRTWGNLKTVATKAPAGEHALALFAVDQARRCGGVVEHPAGSSLFDQCGCGRAGEPDDWGEWVLECDQWHFGHSCAKPTKLYIVGCSPTNLPTMTYREGIPKKCITQGHGVRVGHPLFKSRATQYEREATPRKFAEWLTELATRCHGRYS